MQRHVITTVLLLTAAVACGKKEETPAPAATESAPPATTESAPAPTPTAPAEPTQVAAATPAAVPPPQTAAAVGAAELDLARKSGCLACHAVDKKVVGPAWKDVAARYRGKAEAKAALIDKVKKGGKGNWTELTGGVPMPPYSPRVPDADIEKLINYVLTL
jgi:cytochrome c